MYSKFLIVIGPSGVGKSTLVASLSRAGRVKVFPTWTTRPRRHYERPHESDHVFCSRSEFEQKVAEKFFIETVQLFELEHLYGLPRLEEPAPGAPVPVLMLRATLLDRVARHLSNYAVYQVEAPAERVRAHLETRAERDGEQGSRFADFERELSLGRRFAQRVIDTSQGLELAVRTSLQYLEQDFGQCPRTEVVSCVE